MGCTLFLLQRYNPYLRYRFHPSVKRQHRALKWQLVGVNGLHPPLEFGDSSLRYYDTLGGIYSEIQRQTATKPHRDILNSTARDDKLTVGAEEALRGELLAQRLKSLIHRIGISMKRSNRNTLLGGVEEGNIIHGNGDKLILIA